jgi:hypothetical protein
LLPISLSLSLSLSLSSSVAENSRAYLIASSPQANRLLLRDAETLRTLVKGGGSNKGSDDQLGQAEEGGSSALNVLGQVSDPVLKKEAAVLAASLLGQVNFILY